MRFMRAVNRDAMHQEVSSPQAAGGGGEVSSSSGGRENAGLGFLRLPVKRRHSEVDATLPPQKVSSFSHPQTPVLPQETTEPEQSASFPAQIEVPSITEMQAIDGLRALATSEADTPESQPIPSIETPAPTCITVATCPPPAPTTKATPNPKKLARDHLFDAIVAASMRANGSTVDRSGNPVPSADDMLWRRIITGPDDLERAESVRLFEILEACSYATQPETPVTTTRGNIDRFFDAVFRNWDPEDWDAEAAKTARPDFSVSAETIAGKVCGTCSLSLFVSLCVLCVSVRRGTRFCIQSEELCFNAGLIHVGLHVCSFELPWLSLAVCVSLPSHQLRRSAQIHHLTLTFPRLLVPFRHR